MSAARVTTSFFCVCAHCAVNDAVIAAGSTEVRLTNLRKPFWKKLGIAKRYPKMVWGAAASPATS